MTERTGEEVSPPTVRYYTDGSCLSNPGGPGGWAFVADIESAKENATGWGNYPTSTNNRMEQEAALQALRHAYLSGYGKGLATVTIVSDSSYVVQGMTEWVPRWISDGSLDSRPNADLWLALVSASADVDVMWDWVRGHSGHPLNEQADQLAREAALRIATPVASDLRAL